MASLHSLPWVIAGDFNVVLMGDDKLGIRVRLFWVKMISGNHFHPFPHVRLSRKISFSEK